MSYAVSIVLIMMGGIRMLENGSIALTGLANFCVIPVALWFIKMDAARKNPLKSLHRGMSVKDGLWMLVLGAAGAYVMNMLLALSQLHRLFPGYGKLAEQLNLDQQPLWLLVLAGGILAPIAEELIFRGLVYFRLRDYLGVKKGIVISSLFFGIYHGTVVQGLYAFLMGMLFAYGTEKFQSLWAGILLHVAANSWMFILQTFIMGWSKVLYGVPLLVLVVLQFAVTILSLVKMKDMDS